MPFRFGQIILLIACLLVAGFLDFYLGARFGPEVFWGISLDRTVSNKLLPKDVPNDEIERMLAQESADADLVFNEALKRKGEVPGAVGDLPDVVAENKKEVPKEEEIKKTEVKETAKETAKDTAKEIKEAKLEIKSEEKTQVKEEPKIESKSETKPEVKKEVALTKTEAQANPRYSLQVGSYSEKEKALSTMAKFKAAGLSASLGETQIPQKGTWYRVYVGQYVTAEEAESAKQKIYNEQQVLAVVVSR